MKGGRGLTGRNEVALRIVRLMRVLAGRRRVPALGVLARELQVHPRTVRRYLQALEEAEWICPREGRWDGRLELAAPIDAGYVDRSRFAGRTGR